MRVPPRVRNRRRRDALLVDRACRLLLHLHGRSLRRRLLVRGPERSSSSSIERGRCVAALLEGCWRPSPPPPLLSSKELAEIAPLVLATGGGALAFRRLKQANLVAEALPFQQAYRLHALDGAVHEQQIPAAVLRLRAAGVEPILGKGWAAARGYPEAGLRPYGDIDLFVPASRHAAAVAALRTSGAAPLPVDLHAGFADLDDQDSEDLVSRSRTAELGGVPVRLFGPEHHVRLLALHGLRHGLARPVWLCDVAALLEQEPEAFDWDGLLHGRPRRTEAVVCVIALAGRLLGARLRGAPAAVSARALPSWLELAVLRQWGTGSAWRGPLEGYLRRPPAALRELHRHWPDALASTVGVGAPFNELPRLPFQLAYAVIRFAGALRRSVARGRVLSGS